MVTRLQEALSTLIQRAEKSVALHRDPKADFDGACWETGQALKYLLLCLFGAKDEDQDVATVTQYFRSTLDTLGLKSTEGECGQCRRGPTTQEMVRVMTLLTSVSSIYDFPGFSDHAFEVCVALANYKRACDLQPLERATTDQKKPLPSYLKVVS
jgi:hypothetical protein